MNKLPLVTVYGDGVTDDTDAIEKIMNGEAKGVSPDGSPFASVGRKIIITRTIKLKPNAPGGRVL